MELTLICASKQEHIYRGSRVYSVELINTEDLEDGILDATFHFETANPELAGRFAINESYRVSIPE
ncbi:MAG TPA: hypothetical protein VKA55_00505 [Gammaproteobacteria bacterium]|nr:hypothetical protein [Gammaproteobacteria bacterium]